MRNNSTHAKSDLELWIHERVEDTEQTATLYTAEPGTPREIRQLRFVSLE